MYIYIFFFYNIAETDWYNSGVTVTVIIGNLMQ